MQSLMDGDIAEYSQKPSTKNNTNSHRVPVALMSLFFVIVILLLESQRQNTKNLHKELQVLEQDILALRGMLNQSAAPKTTFMDSQSQEGGGGVAAGAGAGADALPPPVPGAVPSEGSAYMPRYPAPPPAIPAPVPVTHAPSQPQTPTPSFAPISPPVLEEISANKLLELDFAPTKAYHIFQFSHSGVASTMTVNLLTGLFDGRYPPTGYLEVKGQWRYFKGPFNRTLVIKTHFRDVDELTRRYGNQTDRLFFIGNNRREANKILPDKYCSSQDPKYSNVMCLEYEDLQYNNVDELWTVVRHVKSRILESFPFFQSYRLKEEEAVQRLLDMAEFIRTGNGNGKERFGIGGGSFMSHTLEAPNNTSSDNNTSGGN